ncbi:DUF6011 domain-containing protein [Virgibacillus sp. W0430]
MNSCNRCGRKLKTEKSIETGFGPVCYKKHLKEQEEFEKNHLTIDEIA